MSSPERSLPRSALNDQLERRDQCEHREESSFNGADWPIGRRPTGHVFWYDVPTVFRWA